MLGVPIQYESVALMLSHKWISVVVPKGTVFVNPVTYYALLFTDCSIRVYRSFAATCINVAMNIAILLEIFYKFI